jgi:hypothetical protein
VFPEVWNVPTRVYNAVLAATPSPLDVMVAARDVDLSWFVAGLGDGTVKMRYASDLPRVLNALREALAANKDATPAPLDVQRLARALRKCSLIPSLYRGPVEAWFPNAAAIAAAYAEETP